MGWIHSFLANTSLGSQVPVNARNGSSDSKIRMQSCVSMVAVLCGFLRQQWLLSIKLKQFTMADLSVLHSSPFMISAVLSNCRNVITSQSVSDHLVSGRVCSTFSSRKAQLCLVGLQALCWVMYEAVWSQTLAQGLGALSEHFLLSDHSINWSHDFWFWDFLYQHVQLGETEVKK